MADMTQSPVKAYTVKEFWDYVHLPENAGRLELVNGKVVEKESATQLTSVIGGRIAYFLNRHVLPQNNGYVTDATAYYALSTTDCFLPNVAYISKKRHSILMGGYFPSAPDLAIEIIQPNTKAYRSHSKLSTYARHGVKAVWEVYPDTKSMNIMYFPAKRGVSLNYNDVLVLGDILPGFTLKVSDIFPK
ncbi:MAG: Uma2 family endonuclease [Chloroflexi bacterium]|nr:Uma2 family endonuclease [Chloroflexota bacterium]MCC6896650.1 Uma2 family endonuclease [Anaerolineae bacterium]